METLPQACLSKIFAYLHADECKRMFDVSQACSSAMLTWICEDDSEQCPVEHETAGHHGGTARDTILEHISDLMDELLAIEPRDDEVL